MTDSIVTNPFEPSEPSPRPCPASSVDKTDRCMIRSSQRLNNFKRLYPSLCDFMDENTINDCPDGTTSTHLGDIERVTNMSAAYQGLRVKFQAEAMDTSGNNYLRASSLSDKAQTALKKLHFDFHKELEFANLLYWPNMKRDDAETSWPVCLCGGYEDGSVDMEDWEVPKTLAECADENQYPRFDAQSSRAPQTSLLLIEPKKRPTITIPEASKGQLTTSIRTSKYDRVRAWLQLDKSQSPPGDGDTVVTPGTDTHADLFFLPASISYDRDSSDRSPLVYKDRGTQTECAKGMSRAMTLTTVASAERVPSHTTSQNLMETRSRSGDLAGSSVEPHPTSSACTQIPMLSSAIGIDTLEDPQLGSGISGLSGLPLDDDFAPARKDQKGLISNELMSWSQVVRTSIANGRPWNLTAPTSASAVVIDWTPSQPLRKAGEEKKREVRGRSHPRATTVE